MRAARPNPALRSTKKQTSVVADWVATVIPKARSEEESPLGEPEIPLPSGHRNDRSCTTETC